MTFPLPLENAFLPFPISEVFSSSNTVLYHSHQDFLNAALSLETSNSAQNLGQQFGEFLKEVGTVVVTIIVDVELSDQAGYAPELYNGLQCHLLHLVRHLGIFHSDDLHEFFDVHLAIVQRIPMERERI